jgi:hypothetical protein
MIQNISKPRRASMEVMRVGPDTAAGGGALRDT